MDRPWSGQVPDRGQAIPILVLVVASIGAMASSIGVLGAQMAAGERAATAADAAALAGVLHGPQAAAALAAANGARLVSCASSLDPAGNETVTVAVEVEGPLRSSHAVARAAAFSATP